jgi:endonuclease/exonuclease/phosphatase family metal-dependent hydrolase
MPEPESLRILMSNIGYARGFSGALAGHAGFAHRHVWCPPSVQRRVLSHFQALLGRTKPDLCCLLEIDTGSFTSAGMDQLEYLKTPEYGFADAENKYLETSPLRRFAFTRGKSNGLIATHDFPFTKLYFACGTKRLIYQVTLAENLTLYFTHFSLTREVRRRQLIEMGELVLQTPGETMVLGDFNLLQGLHELTPLFAATGMKLVNDAEIPTFLFHRRRLTLDLCLCTPQLAARTQVEVIPQSYSDHAALLVEVRLR